MTRHLAALLLSSALAVLSGCDLSPVPNGGLSAEASAEDVSSPDQVIGSGTPESCTAAAFIAAVAAGGVIVFDSGGLPATIVLSEPAKVFNDKPDLVIDGGGLVTLSGGGTTRILYLNTSDPDQAWTTEHSDNQEHPRLTVQNIDFVDGDSSAEGAYDGGGAIYASGGRFKAVNCRFYRNRCASSGQDVGGGALRVFNQYEDLPVYVVGCVFGGSEGNGNHGSNGGAVSSIGVSWTFIDCVLSYNYATGTGGNPGDGGCGGAIYNDGNTMTLTLRGTRVEHNSTTAFGSAIFFVSNDHSGDISIDSSIVRNNTGGSWYPKYPGISMHEDTPVAVVDSTLGP